MLTVKVTTSAQRGLYMSIKNIPNSGIIVDTSQDLHALDNVEIHKNTLIMESDTGKMRVGKEGVPYKDLEVLPTTFSAQNAEYSGLFNNAFIQYNIPAIGDEAEITFPSSTTQENPELLELTSTGRVKIKKSGIYFVKYSATLAMGAADALYDTVLKIYRHNASDQTTDIISAMSWLVSEQKLNPNTGFICTTCPFNKGDEVYLTFAFPLSGDYSLQSSCNFVLLPSIASSAETQIDPGTVSHMAMPSNDSVDISITEVQEDGSFTTIAPDDGYACIYAKCNRSELTGISITSVNTGIGSLYHTSSVGQEANLFIPVSKGNEIRVFIGSLENWSKLQLKFVYANGTSPKE